MNIFTPIVLFGWVIVAIILFFCLKTHLAILYTIIGGLLFLPMATYDMPLIPEYSKSTAISLGLLLGLILSGKFRCDLYKLNYYDLPMIIFCLCSIVTSLVNGLGIYDGISTSLKQIIVWGIPYLFGRMFFKNIITFQDLCVCIVIGGLLYVPLCFYEIRMSPQLSNIIYGFFPHQFDQHIRYGGYRPIVFMQHGLMVSMWMASSTIMAFWLWKNKVIDQIMGIPISIVFMVLFLTTILCKSGNGWFAVGIGCVSYYLFKKFKTIRIFRIIILIIPLYIFYRSTNLISGDTIYYIASLIFDEERAHSIIIRLLQEDLFSAKAFESLIWGWGGYDRGWPIDLATGKKMIKLIDSLWIITFSKFGLVGLCSLYLAILIGPWKTFRILEASKQNHKFIYYLIPVGMIIICFMFDTLANAMINPVYILCMGALVSYNSKSITKERVRNALLIKSVQIQLPKSHDFQQSGKLEL